MKKKKFYIEIVNMVIYIKLGMYFKAFHLPIDLMKKKKSTYL